jgi:large subunit ribosomal protein L24
MAAKIRKGDQVVVITGAARGTVGTVSRVLPEFSQVVVEGVNRVKRHMKPSPRMPEGGIIEKDRPIHISNVALVDPTTGKPTRVRFQTDEQGKKSRVAVGSGTVIAANTGNQNAQSRTNEASETEADAG